MAFILKKPTMAHRHAFEDMMDEWEAHGGKIFPSVIRRLDSANNRKIPYTEFMQTIEANREEGICAANIAPQDVYFLFDEQGTLLGATVIRHRLNEEMLQTGGHIGGGIRPSWQSRGLGTRMLALAIEKARTLGIKDVLLTCNDDNVASQRIIEKNGGVYENSVVEAKGTVVKRFWVYG